MNREKLVKTLELASKALAKNDLVPVFQCFQFHNGLVTAYNDDIGIVAPCPLEGSFAVTGRTLLELLQNSKDEEVDFTLEPSNVIIKTGRSTFKMPYMKEDDFIFNVPDIKPSATMPLDGSLLVGINACLLTTSSDLAQEAFTVIAVNPLKHTLSSCDGDVITRCRIGPKVTVLGTGQDDFLVPASFCDAVMKITDAEGIAEADRLGFDREWAWASIAGKYEVYGRLVQAKVPVDHEQLIRDTLKGEPVYVPIPEGLKEALARARVVADPESAKTEIAVEAGRMKLVTQTHAATVRDSIAFDGHKPVVATTYASLLHKALEGFKEFSILDRCTVLRYEDKRFRLIPNL